MTMSDSSEFLRQRCDKVEVRANGADGKGKVFLEAHGCVVDPTRPNDKVDLQMLLNIEVKPTKKK